ncbi:PREDICTED: integrin alpha-10 [Calidris pugnax]|uniref:integrin alpha-10 n=1 Tax=Calidris pugnax TaxID=198806 RepID=UPI00071D86A6|nr:PREDICTED: integrin alpha-10 [Calidris pugnax]
MGRAVTPTPKKSPNTPNLTSGSPEEKTRACAPLWSQECGTSLFSTGICARLDEDLRPVGTIAPTAQRCSTYMDIVIVLDGSNSIYPWYEVQNFLSNILSKFFIGPGQIQVGVLQYGEEVVHEWVLGRYRTAEEVVEAAKNISRQEGRETRTALAIHRACAEAFSPERGGRADATRLMIVVTDGESHDGEELPEALAECEERNVTRYAIAVLGHYLRRQQDPEDFIREIKYIASDPDEKFFFNVTDEAALNDIVDALGDRIFSLEGTHGYNESSFELEMSQIGFSVHLLEDGILFGTVGAYDWDGAVLEESRRGRIVPPRKAFQQEFPLELKNHAAYLGYAVSSLRLPDGQRLYVAGAPRFQHKGKVILFQMDTTGTVRVAQALTGEQIGSYFGSEVCPLDVEGDGVTDVLLVAAPMYLGAQSRETGRVYLYRVGQQLLAPAGTLHADKKPQDSRFGYALAAVPDLNHDGLNDVVVGAPLEDGHRGAVYVYHGAPGTLLPHYKQRIEGAALGPTLSYFGRSLDGRLDMDGDGLVDLAVGAQGAAVLLRSRQIVQVNTSLTVEPPAINVIQKNCQRGGTGAVCLRARVCFRAGTRARGQRDRDIELRYNVSLEEKTPGARAAFDSGARRLLQRRLELSLGRQSCLRFPFHVLDTTDYLRPLSFTVRLAMAESTGPVLDEASPTTIRKLIPFFKDCGEDDECVTDLVLKATMDIAGSRQSPHVLRKGRRKVVVDVVLENKKENAYNASLLLRFSSNLHFSSLVLQDTSSVKLECTALAGHRRLCSVGYPVFRSLAKLRYNVSLEEKTPGARAAFDSGARRLLQRRLELSLGRQSCLRFPFHVLVRGTSLGHGWPFPPPLPTPSSIVPELRYNVSLEEKTPGARAAFDSGARRLLQRRLELSLGRQSCLRFPFHVLDTTDYLRPLSFTVRLAMAESTGPVLDEASPTTIRKLVGAGGGGGIQDHPPLSPSVVLPALGSHPGSFQIPFFKDCGEDDECVTDLVLKATMDIAGSRQSPHVLRKGRRKVVVDVVLENKKENAYNASLLLRFSSNLHFSSLVLQDTSSVKLECTALAGHRRLCSVGYPVFRSLAKVGDQVPPP